jgi:hypothetical protein
MKAGQFVNFQVRDEEPTASVRGNESQPRMHQHKGALALLIGHEV